MKRLPAWMAVALAALGLAALYAGPLGTRFLNDDYLFLEEARTRSLASSIGDAGALRNYYRPLSRQVYFELLTPIAGAHPLVFHVANALLFAAGLILLWDLLRAFLPPAGAMAGGLYFALLPLQRVNLIWVSCSQDLIALVGSLAVVALYRRGRIGWALLAYALALAGKESALPLPLALLALSLLEGRSFKRAALGVAPFVALGVMWMALALSIVGLTTTARFTRFDAGQFAAGYVHLVQSLLGLETLPDAFTWVLRRGPAWVPLLLLLPIAFWYAAAARDHRSEPGERGESPAAPPPAEPGAASRRLRPEPGAAAPRRAERTTERRAILFALVWLAAFGAVTWPVTHTWSSYYYTLAAAGGALLVGLLFRRGDRWTWAFLVVGLLWWHSAATGARTFAVADRPWGWTSHLTSYYFERGAAMADSMSRQLLRLEPRPAEGTRYFFATLPPWAGFQMGNGALIRHLYRDPSLRSHFYSQFSDSTAGMHPSQFLYWDGARLAELYPRQRDLFFQVGSDLLLLDRPEGAAHAFRRGLMNGGDRMDHLYWLGWALLWSDRRDAAEAVWQAFGAIDDSSRWDDHLRAARQSLIDRGDTLEARRHLIRAIEYGIGRPEGHAVLGELLIPERPKYGALELKVASWLKPDDWIARRGLALSLADARLDDQARKELRALARIYPQWRADSAVARAWRALEGHDPAMRRVARF